MRAVGASLQVAHRGNRKCTFRDGQTQQVRTVESLKEDVREGRFDLSEPKATVEMNGTP